MTRPSDVCARCGHTAGVHLAPPGGTHASCFVIGCACACFLTREEQRVIERAARERAVGRTT